MCIRDRIVSFFFQAEDGIRDFCLSRGLGDVYKRQLYLENGKTGDDYMQKAQKFAAQIPYMAIAGNHEIFRNYTYLNLRFKMPLYDQFQNVYYSFNLGLVHYVCFNIQYFHQVFEAREGILSWLREDLQRANSNESRSQRPWIVAIAHKPFFTSLKAPKADTHTDYGNFTQIEDLYLEFSVDMYLSGHVHFYERMLPVFRNQSRGYEDFNQTYIIKNAQATVHIIDGISGTDHEITQELDKSEWNEYTAAMSSKFGFGIVDAINKTHLKFSQTLSQNFTQEDSFYLSLIHI
eukprot:TRINITY_DN3419_c0_g2_i6.p1 TRINITY_DN3419_c0_g2~~TRINITY_DN3419_c0_g2_i6.p1  ORF type:complete len:291 (-),score=57.66 TRINITY_DN3419_c0_g2_i6:61-933(-)